MKKQVSWWDWISRLLQLSFIFYLVADRASAKRPDDSKKIEYDLEVMKAAAKEPNPWIMPVGSKQKFDPVFYLNTNPSAPLAKFLIDEELRRNGHRSVSIKRLAEVLESFGGRMKTERSAKRSIEPWRSSAKTLLDYFILLRSDTHTQLGTTLSVAIRRKQHDLVQLILWHGFEPTMAIDSDSRSEMALITALRVGDPAVIKMMVRQLICQTLSTESIKLIKTHDKDSHVIKLFRYNEQITAALKKGLSKETATINLYNSALTECVELCAKALKEFPDQIGLVMWSLIARLRLNQFDEVKNEFLSLNKKYSDNRLWIIATRNFGVLFGTITDTGELSHASVTDEEIDEIAKVVVLREKPLVESDFLNRTYNGNWFLKPPIAPEASLRRWIGFESDDHQNNKLVEMGLAFSLLMDRTKDKRFVLNAHDFVMTNQSATLGERLDKLSELLRYFEAHHADELFLYHENFAVMFAHLAHLVLAQRDQYADVMAVGIHLAKIAHVLDPMPARVEYQTELYEYAGFAAKYLGKQRDAYIFFRLSRSVQSFDLALKLVQTVKLQALSSVLVKKLGLDNDLVAYATTLIETFTLVDIQPETLRGIPQTFFADVSYLNFYADLIRNTGSISASLRLITSAKHELQRLRKLNALPNELQIGNKTLAYDDVLRFLDELTPKVSAPSASVINFSLIALITALIAMLTSIHKIFPLRLIASEPRVTMSFLHGWIARRWKLGEFRNVYASVQSQREFHNAMHVAIQQLTAQLATVQSSALVSKSAVTFPTQLMTGLWLINRENDRFTPDTIPLSTEFLVKVAKLVAKEFFDHVKAEFSSTQTPSGFQLVMTTHVRASQRIVQLDVSEKGLRGMLLFAQERLIEQCDEFVAYRLNAQKKQDDELKKKNDALSKQRSEEEFNKRKMQLIDEANEAKKVFDQRFVEAKKHEVSALDAKDHSKQLPIDLASSLTKASENVLVMTDRFNELTTFFNALPARSTTVKSFEQITALSADIKTARQHSANLEKQLLEKGGKLAVAMEKSTNRVTSQKAKARLNVKRDDDGDGDAVTAAASSTQVSATAIANSMADRNSAVTTTAIPNSVAASSAPGSFTSDASDNAKSKSRKYFTPKPQPELNYELHQLPDVIHQSTQSNRATNSNVQHENASLTVMNFHLHKREIIDRITHLEARISLANLDNLYALNHLFAVFNQQLRFLFAQHLCDLNFLQHFNDVRNAFRHCLHRFLYEPKNETFLASLRNMATRLEEIDSLSIQDAGNSIEPFAIWCRALLEEGRRAELTSDVDAKKARLKELALRKKQTLDYLVQKREAMHKTELPEVIYLRENKEAQMSIRGAIATLGKYHVELNALSHLPKLNFFRDRQNTLAQLATTTAPLSTGDVFLACQLFRKATGHDYTVEVGPVGQTVNDEVVSVEVVAELFRRLTQLPHDELTISQNPPR